MRIALLALALLAGCQDSTEGARTESPSPARTSPEVPSPTFVQETGAVGDTLVSPLGNETTLHSWREARDVARFSLQPDETFYEADVEFCLTGEADPGLEGSDVAFSFRAETEEARSFHPDGTGYRDDYLILQFAPIQPGECIRGPIGFVIPRELGVEELSYDVTDGVLRWEV
jgi:hypothetical protein